MDYKRATAVLGLTGVVITEAAILKAWKRKISMSHPDKSADVNANQATQLLNEAKDSMLKAFEEGRFEDDAISELNEIMVDFKREMDEYNEEIKRNAIECRERMKWFFRQDKAKYLEAEGLLLKNELNKKKTDPKPKKEFKRRHLGLNQYPEGRAVIKAINQVIDEDLEPCPDFITFSCQFVDHVMKKNPQFGKGERALCRRNFGRFLKEKYTNLRHFCFRGQRGYQHIRIKGETEMLEFPPIPNQYELMTHAEYRKRYKHPKKSPNETNADKVQEKKENVSEHTL